MLKKGAKDEYQSLRIGLGALLGRGGWRVTAQPRNWNVTRDALPIFVNACQESGG